MSEGRASYSQLGEDMIIEGLANSMGILAQLTYLDIGANSPRNLSNTYRFYEMGRNGVLVEPDPTLCPVLKKERPRDKTLNVGISIDGCKDAEFYILTARTLNTFSKENALKNTSPEAVKYYGIQKIEATIRVPMMTLNEVVETQFSACPNFVSIDTEGMDLPILKTFDFKRFRPEIFCIETDGGGGDKDGIVAYMKEKGYGIFAFTGLNTIFRK